MLTIQLNPALLAVGVAILAHAAATIWWASKMNSTMNFIKIDLDRIGRELEKRDSQISAIWKRMDELKDRIIDQKEPT